MSNVPVPFKLEELQRAEVERWKIEPTRAVLDASKMSQGKTIMAAQFAIEMDFERVLIVGIKDTWDSWSETVHRQSAGTITMRRMDTTKDGEANIQAFLAGEEGWYYIGHGLFSRRDWSTADKGKKDSKGRDMKSKVHHFYWRKHPVDFFAVDEIHLASNKMSNLWKTMGTISAGWKHGMSGTFWNNQFPNAWAVARFLWGDLIDPSRPRWLDQHCEKSTTYAKGGRKITEYGAELVPGRFVASLPCYPRLDDGDKPPEPIIVPVELNAEQRRVYDDLERDLFVWLKSHPLTVEYPVTLRARLRQVTLATPSIDPETDEVYFEDDAQSSKYEAAASVLFDECDETFLHLTDSQRYARYLTNRLRADGYVAEEWSGKISGKDREAIKERFIAGEIQHLVAVIAAVSTGLDGFQTACRRIMWHSYSDNATTNEQATYRIYRRGGDKENFKQYFLSARNTKDEGMYSSLVEQQIKKNETLRKSRQIVAENVWTAPAQA